MDEHTCPWWFVYSFDNPIRRLVHDPVPLLGGLVGEGQTAVDLGCGAGYFTLPLAQIVGPEGRVIALDVQPRMLKTAERRARRRRLDDRVDFRLCHADRLRLVETVDFVLAFWVVHEVAMPEAFLREIRAALKPGGRFLVVEPKVHVPRHRFDATMALARRSGFQVVPGPKIRFSRSILCSTEQA